MQKPLWYWGLFIALIFVLLAIDLGLFHRKSREISTRESLALSSMYILIGLLFGQFVGIILGKQASFEYLTGFLIEKSLSIDNIFVISMIFTTLNIPRLYQHRALFWGILGVIILRGIMIGLGTAVISEFSWVIYIFAGFLIATGFKMFFFHSEEKPIEKQLIFRGLQKLIPLTKSLNTQHFWVKENGKWFATPLFLALVMVECADIIFAVDSVPAVFAITLDPYIVYTSNIFAILGLRALYFALSDILHRFKYLKHSLALVLIFVGGKIFYSELYAKIPATYSLLITVIILTGGVLYSVIRSQEKK